MSYMLYDNPTDWDKFKLYVASHEDTITVNQATNIVAY